MKSCPSYPHLIRNLSGSGNELFYRCVGWAFADWGNREALAVADDAPALRRVAYHLAEAEHYDLAAHLLDAVETVAVTARALSDAGLDGDLAEAGRLAITLARLDRRMHALADQIEMLAGIGGGHV